jgi:hypothetical protein
MALPLLRVTRCIPSTSRLPALPPSRLLIRSHKLRRPQHMPLNGVLELFSGGSLAQARQHRVQRI